MRFSTSSQLAVSRLLLLAVFPAIGLCPAAWAQSAAGAGQVEVALTTRDGRNTYPIRADFDLVATIEPCTAAAQVSQVVFRSWGEWPDPAVVVGSDATADRDPRSGASQYHLRCHREGYGTWSYSAVAMGADGSQLGESAPLPITLPRPVENGIAVVDAKQYDERVLQLRIQSAIAALSGARFPDVTGLFGAVSQVQGATAVSSSLAFSAQTVPTPEITTVTPRATAPAKEASAEGASATSTAPSETKTTPSVSPQVPPAPSQIAPFSYQPSFGISPQDTLAGQIELQYQMINLQMLLERSLTDRVYDVTDGPGGGSSTGLRLHPRAQPVIGFNVSIDPKCVYRGAVAEVEITITPDPQTCGEAGVKAPSLIAMMPLTKTYNAAAWKQSARSLGLGVVASFVNVGMSAGRATQTLYLIKDIDTIGLGQLPATRNSLRLAWQFRPVLGQDSVQPGMRQVFAVIGLPLDSSAPWLGWVTVRTHWRKLGRDRVSVGDIIPGSENCQPPVPLLTRPSDPLGTRLQSVQSIIIEDLGNGNVAVVALGSFQVAAFVNIGNRILDSPQNGLIAWAPGRVKFLASAAELVRNAPLLVDRYGTAVQVTDPAGFMRDPQPSARLVVRDPMVTRIDDTTSRVTLHLQTCSSEPVYSDPTRPELGPSARPRFLPGCEKDDATSDEAALLKAWQAKVAEESAGDRRLHAHLPVMEIGGQVFGLSNAPVQVEACHGLSDVIVRFCAPTQLLAQSHVLTVQDLLWGDSYRAQVSIPQPMTVTKVTVLESSEHTTTVALSGTALDGITVHAGTKPGLPQPCLSSPNLQVFTFCDLSPKTKHLIVRAPSRAGTGRKPGRPCDASDELSVLVPFELPAKPAAEPVLSEEMPRKLIKGDVVQVELSGRNLESIKTISLGSVALPFKVDSNRLLISVPAEVTETAGMKVPAITLTDDKAIQKEKVLSFRVVEE